MSDHDFSDESVDRVLDGLDVAGEDGASTVGAAAALFRQASGQATADELGAADATISRFVELVLEPEAAPARRLRLVPIPARAAAVIVAATIWSTGMAAAATGHLPDPVQRVVASTASHVGLNLPGASDNQDQKSAAAGDEHDGKDENEQGDDTSTSSSSSTATTTASTNGATTSGATTTASASGAATTTGGATTTSAAGAPTSAGGQVRGVGPDVTGPAGDALCAAYRDAIARGKPKNPDAPPWRNLLEASKASGKSIDELCGVTTSAPAATTVPTTVASTSSTSTTTSTTSTTGTTSTEGTSDGGGNGNGNGNGNGQGNGNGHGNSSSP
jgi:hypothetical protein